ncbi:MAG: CdaR family protein [Candidatus Eremiobacteraeota bacterium]|nr:CdaR family protein [Candidatus Eremiobacteraeota bacterium]
MLAIAGWGYFRFANNPIIAARFDQQLSVPITVIRLPVGYVARVPEKAAIVTVAAPKRGASAVRPDDVKAVVDLENRTEGVYTIPIQVVAPNLQIQSLSPASVTLKIVKLEQRSFPLALHYVGVQSRGIVAAATRITPDHAEVRGASDELSRVTAVRVDVPLPAAPQMFDSMVRPVAVDSLGSEVGVVQVAPNLNRVQIHFIAGASH